MTSGYVSAHSLFTRSAQTLLAEFRKSAGSAADILVRLRVRDGREFIAAGLDFIRCETAADHVMLIGGTNQDQHAVVFRDNDLISVDFFAVQPSAPQPDSPFGFHKKT